MVEVRQHVHRVFGFVNVFLNYPLIFVRGRVSQFRLATHDARSPSALAKAGLYEQGKLRASQLRRLISEWSCEVMRLAEGDEGQFVLAKPYRLQRGHKYPEPALFQRPRVSANSGNSSSRVGTTSPTPSRWQSCMNSSIKVSFALADTRKCRSATYSAGAQGLVSTAITLPPPRRANAD